MKERRKTAVGTTIAANAAFLGWLVILAIQPPATPNTETKVARSDPPIRAATAGPVAAVLLPPPPRRPRPAPSVPEAGRPTASAPSEAPAPAPSRALAPIEPPPPQIAASPPPPRADTAMPLRDASHASTSREHETSAPNPVPAGTRRRGRALLHLLKHGQGPSIEIAWPNGAAARSQLYARLRGCHGLGLGLVDANGELRTLDVKDPDADTGSGLVRDPLDRLVRAERLLIATVARGGTDRPVRLFPRRVDADLLGRLDLLVGGDLAGRREIRGAYRFHAGGVVIGDLSIDGRSINARIPLAEIGPSCRG